MRKIVLVTFVLFVVAALAVAQGQNSQAPSTASPSQKSAPQASAAETAIEGCLGGAAGNYTVTDRAGMVYKLQLPNDTQNAVIDKHVGQEVRVKGTLENASAPDSAAAPDSGASKGASEKAKSQVIKAVSLEKIADTCSAKAEAPEKK